MTEFIIEELSQFDEEHFVDALDDVYEESPWVAKQAASERPFDSREDLRATMERVVNEASRDRKLELLRAHPDLGEQTEMTEASREEQSSAGLDELQPEQYEAFQRLNETYRETFDFPFIMAVKGKSPDEIQTAMEDRIDNSESDEFRTALDQVHEIARLRLENRIAQ
ncbi:2-oxo-4-hydroxy-4-carboxy-5-ureidoimidazoline decarboxylase [Natrialba sp. PRR66]|uniref:2-oxo-4-hydroxy-4-carboxy-5-ureidoimidazoline decarboxylase n=1 Tax=Natrialba sp. PRR66 TaxID=3098146 RepID=UPI002B1D387D|nr:2-oxo-4-hydroxy-4-carboxy-5-ureidoimidazoline decarboxylase [Natrialba sp. PRR66]